MEDVVDAGSSQPTRRAAKRVKREDIDVSAPKPVTPLLEDLITSYRRSAFCSPETSCHAAELVFFEGGIELSSKL